MAERVKAVLIEAIKEAWIEIPKDKCEKYETLKESFE